MLFNQGFRQSGIPVTVVAHCYEQTTFSELDVTDYDYLKAFGKMKKKVSDIRNTADFAALFVAYHEDINNINNTVCGAGWTGSYKTNNTLFWVEKKCALKDYSFGHELGHLFGAGKY